MLRCQAAKCVGRRQTRLRHALCRLACLIFQPGGIHEPCHLIGSCPTLPSPWRRSSGTRHRQTYFGLNSKSTQRPTLAANDMLPEHRCLRSDSSPFYGRRAQTFFGCQTQSIGLAAHPLVWTAREQVRGIISKELCVRWVLQRATTTAARDTAGRDNRETDKQSRSERRAQRSRSMWSILTGRSSSSAGSNADPSPHPVQQPDATSPPAVPQLSAAQREAYQMLLEAATLDEAAQSPGDFARAIELYERGCRRLMEGIKDAGSEERKNALRQQLMQALERASS